MDFLALHLMGVENKRENKCEDVENLVSLVCH